MIKHIKNISLISLSCFLINFLLMYFSEVNGLKNYVNIFGLLDSVFIAIIFILLLYTTKNKKLIIVLTAILSIVAYIQYKFFSIFVFGVRLSYISILRELFYIKNTIPISLKEFLFIIPTILTLFLDNNIKKINALYLCNCVLIYLMFMIIVPKASQYFEVYNGVGTSSYIILKEGLTNKEIKIDNVEQVLQKYTLQEQNEYTGLFKDKNLIMILAESLDDFVINEWNMPNTSKLKNEGWYFSNFNVITYPYHTNDSEFISSTGMLPSINYGATSYRFSKNYYPSTINKFFVNSELDHNYLSTFYNRKGMSNNFGYDKTIFGEDIDALNKSVYDITDIQLIDAISFSSKKQPFFNYIITLTMHGNYDKESNDFIDSKLNTDDYELKNYYFKSLIFDEAIGDLISKLEQNNLLEDTVIVIFGDHKPFQMSNPPEDNVIPLIIYNPSIDAKVIDKECSIEDLYPTITNLFGFDTSKWYKAGIDIFSNTPSRMFDPININNEELYELSQYILLEDYYLEEN